MNEHDLARRDARERTRVAEHTRKPAKARASNTEPSKVATSATHALNRIPEDLNTDKPHVYAQALAGVCRRWFGDESLLVARELVRILEASP